MQQVDTDTVAPVYATAPDDRQVGAPPVPEYVEPELMDDTQFDPSVPWATPQYAATRVPDATAAPAASAGALPTADVPLGIAGAPVGAMPEPITASELDASPVDPTMPDVTPEPIGIADSIYVPTSGPGEGIDIMPEPITDGATPATFTEGYARSEVGTGEDMFVLYQPDRSGTAEADASASTEHTRPEVGGIL